MSNFFIWRRRTRNSNSTDIPYIEPAFRYEFPNLRILSMTGDLDGTQFSYYTFVEPRSEPVFTSNWTTTIIGCSKIIGTPGIFLYCETLALNFSLASQVHFLLLLLYKITSLAHSLISQFQLYRLPTAQLLCIEWRKWPSLLFSSSYMLMDVRGSFSAHCLRLLRRVQRNQLLSLSTSIIKETGQYLFLCIGFAHVVTI